MFEVENLNVETVLINIRDGLLGLITGVNREQVLNSHNGNLDHGELNDPAAELKQALDRIKASAIDGNGTRVDYARLRNSQVYEEFQHNCSPKIRGFDPENLVRREEKLAFWINLYNALVLDAVIDYGVQHSVTEGWLGLLTFFRNAAYNIGGQRMSLDDIEHGVLRDNRGHPAIPGPQFAANDPRMKWVIDPPDVRIHFALNCASRSCPPFQVYSGDQMGNQLDMAARNFVNQTATVDQKTNKLSVSSIFRWYQSDFGGQQELINFILNHLPDDERREWLGENKKTIRLQYEPYDWHLNV
jgi:hypothetical protein